MFVLEGRKIISIFLLNSYILFIEILIFIFYREYKMNENGVIVLCQMHYVNCRVSNNNKALSYINGLGLDLDLGFI